MLKKVLAVVPEFNNEFLHYQPWHLFYKLGIRMSKRGINFVIATEATDQNEIKGIKIMKLEEKKLRILSKLSMKKILDFNPDVIFWMGNPLSGNYIKKNSLGNIPIILYVSSMHMMWKEIKNLTLHEILKSNLLNFFTAFFPFKNLVKDLNHGNIIKIIVPNNTIKDRLVKLGVFENKITKAPLCYESDFEKNVTAEAGSNKLFTLCYLGPSTSIRGTKILFDLIENLKNENTPVNLNFLLRTPNPETERPFFENLCQQKKISEFVKIQAGFKNKKSLEQEMIKSDLIIIPTKFVHNEPPLVILEAMDLGKPVVTTNVCGLKELIGENGFVVNPNTQSFLKFINFAMKNPKLLQETGKKGKKFVESLPDWDAMTDWTIKILEDCYKKTHD